MKTGKKRPYILSILCTLMILTIISCATVGRDFPHLVFLYRAVQYGEDRVSSFQERGHSPHAAQSATLQQLNALAA